MNDGKQRKTGALFSYVLIIVNTLISVLYTPFLIAKLGQNEYGLYSLVTSIIGYLTILDLGFGNALIVYTSKFRAQKKYDEEKKLHGMFFVIFCIIGLITGILGLIIYFNVENIFGSSMTLTEISKAKIMMLILSFNLVVTFSFSIYTSIITAYEKFVYQKIIALISTLLKPLIMIPFLYLGYKSITMAVIITAVNIFVLISNYLFCKKKLNINIKYNGFDKKLFKLIFGYSIFLFLGSIVDKVNWSVDQFILGAMAGTAAVSIYSVASLLNTLFINLSTAISGVLLPKMSQMVANNASSEKMTKEFIKVGRIQYYIIFLMASGLVLFGKQFICMWVGKEFIESYYVALILILPLCFPLIQNLGLSIMQAMNKYKFKSISTFIMAIFNVLISIILVKKYGVIGAAMGTAIALIICNIFIINIYYYRVIKINVIKFWKDIFILTLKFILPVCFGILLINIFETYQFLYFIISVGIYSIVYIIYCYFLCLNNYETNLIDNLLKKLHIIRR